MRSSELLASGMRNSRRNHHKRPRLTRSDRASAHRQGGSAKAIPGYLSPESGHVSAQASLTRVGSTRSSGSSAYVTAGLLQRGDHRSVHALGADIRAWVKAWNDNPFVWTEDPRPGPGVTRAT